MKFIKGENLYYYNKPVIIHVIPIRDYEGLYGSVTVKKIIVGHDEALYLHHYGKDLVGKDISANELQGISVTGLTFYLFKEKPLIERIFEDNNKV